jgi:hypothetical protein
VTPEATGIPALDAVIVWGGAATVIAGLAALGWRVIRGALHLAQRVDQFIDDWAGEEARPGVLERIGGIEDRLDRVEHELYPNHGASLRDVIDRFAAVVCPEEEGDRGARLMWLGVVCSQPGPGSRSTRCGTPSRGTR